MSLENQKWPLAEQQSRHVFFVGSAFISVIIYVPQRFQVVNGDSPFQAGYRLLALTLATSAGAAIAGLLTQNLKIAACYVFAGAGLAQTLGLALTSSLSGSQHDIPRAIYGYQVIMGVGFGISLAGTMMTIPSVVQKRDNG